MLQVTILNTLTGETRQSPPNPEEWKSDQWDGSWDAYWWSEGNGSCDCNRRIVFEGPPAIGDNHPCQSQRYRIIAVEPMPDGYTLADFNEGYP